MSEVISQQAKSLVGTSSNRIKAEERTLLVASRFYARESRWKSWWCLISTLSILLFFCAVAGWADNILVRSAASLLAGLTLVRMFIIYHDYLHQAIFVDAPLASLILTGYGHLMLTAPTVWKRSHDHHHRNNSKIFGVSIGSFPVMTTSNFQVASRAERIEYRIARSPLIILFGYVSVFLFGMCIRPLMLDFQRNLGVFITLAIHFGTIAVLTTFYGWTFAAFVFVIPTWIAMAAGSYLFYVQHNFPEAKIRDLKEWSYTDAALAASSYLELGAVMRWFTGNIGYHHIHHLNSKIPFYRLPEAMAGLVELQNPGRTSLRIAEIFRCLRLKLWDVERDQFVPFR